MIEYNELHRADKVYKKGTPPEQIAADFDFTMEKVNSAIKTIPTE